MGEEDGDVVDEEMKKSLLSIRIRIPEDSHP